MFRGNLLKVVGEFRSGHPGPRAIRGLRLIPPPCQENVIILRLHVTEDIAGGVGDVGKLRLGNWGELGRAGGLDQFGRSGAYGAGAVASLVWSCGSFSSVFMI